MNRKKIKNIGQSVSFFTVIILFLASFISCANDYTRGPKGGAEDKIAPKVLEYYPALGSLNQDRNIDVTIEFDEYINYNSTKKAITISPLTAFDKSDISWGEKNVTISFSDLEEDETILVIVNTTLKDLRKNSIEDNFILNFSTGSYLDSAGISGKIECSIIEDNIKIINEKKLKVFLYDYNELKDSTIWSKNLRAEYEIGVNKNLEFNLDHIKDGSYLPLVFKDNIGNGKLDINHKDAIYTFGNEIITLKRNEKKKYNYFLGKQDTIAPYITDIRSLNIDLVEVEFSEKIKFPLESKIISSINLETNVKDSTFKIREYLLNEKYKENPSKFLYLTTDSLIENSTLYLASNYFQDLYFNEVNENLTSKNIILPDSISSSELKLLGILPGQVIRDEKVILKFNKIKLESLSVKLIEKKQDNKVIDLSNDLIFEPFRSILDFEKIDNIEDGKYKILVEYGLSDTLFYKDFIITKEKQGYGSISGNIISAPHKSNGEIEILLNQLDNDKKIYKITKKRSEDSYKLKVRPGKYLVAAYIDEDDNGLYSVGEFWGMNNFFSEQATVIKDTIVVRKNWESSGFDIDFSKE